MRFRLLPQETGFYLPGQPAAARERQPVEGASSAVYLLVENRSCVLLDAGQGSAVLDTVLHFIGSRHLRLEYIILTHDHYDHTANASQLREHFGCPVLCHPADRPFIEQPLRIFDDSFMEDYFRRTVSSAFYEMSGHGSYDDYRRSSARNFYYPQKIDGVMEDGDIIPLGDRCMEVWHTPGHSPGSISLYLPTAGAVFCGDAVLQVGPGRPYPLGDVSQWKRSLDELMHLRPRLVAWGHGEPIWGQPECARFLAGVLHGVEALQESIMRELGDSGPSTLDTLVGRVFDRPARGIHPRMVEGSLHCLLHGLRESGLVERLETSRGTLWRLKSKVPAAARGEER